MQKILSDELDCLEDYAWELLGVDRTEEERKKLQAKVHEAVLVLWQEGDDIMVERTEISTIAVLTIVLCRYEIKRWESPQAAVSLLSAAARAVGLWEGHNLRPPIEEVESFVGRRAAHARHEDDRKKAEAIKAWYRQNRDNHSSMDAAAAESAEIFSVAFRTARKHIGIGSKELRSARKE
ncbi:MAG: hypothetical protein V5B60_14370 [Accumulibacter sp.]|jgi:hypothetical protein|uniref:hypothetical protein n=1 Tax=Accumulibacter sp. TaxID=2053492 RepID=UPI002FC354F9